MRPNAIALTPTLIVESDPKMQQRLQRLVETVQGQDTRVIMAASLAQARAVLADEDIALALVDIGLPDGQGADFIAWLGAHHPRTRALVVSAWEHEAQVLVALRAGAVGFLLKERSDEELASSLMSVRRGGAPIDPAIAPRVLAVLPAAVPPAPKTDVSLSERETEILKLVARGYSNREIAELVSLSRLTIEGYTKGIYRKLSVSSRTAAVFEAKNLGLLY